MPEPETLIVDAAPQMTQSEGLRAFGCSAGLGAVWGWAAGVALLLGIDPTLDGLLPAVAIALVYGGTIGAVVGLVLGMPTAAVVARLRSRTRHWRGAGAGVAASGALIAGGVFALGEWDALGWEGLLILAVPVAASAASAWVGLGWIFAVDD